LLYKQAINHACLVTVDHARQFRAHAVVCVQAISHGCLVDHARQRRHELSRVRSSHQPLLSGHCRIMQDNSGRTQSCAFKPSATAVWQLPIMQTTQGTVCVQAISHVCLLNCRSCKTTQACLSGNYRSYKPTQVRTEP
jgi:hypothetical protein